MVTDKSSSYTSSKKLVFRANEDHHRKSQLVTVWRQTGYGEPASGNTSTSHFLHPHFLQGTLQKRNRKIIRARIPKGLWRYAVRESKATLVQAQEPPLPSLGLLLAPYHENKILFYLLLPWFPPSPEIQNNMSTNYIVKHKKQLSETIIFLF